MHRPVAQLLLYSILVCLFEPVSAAEIRVAVAANFADTLAAIAAPFETRTQHDVIIVRGSTGKLYAQLMNGAPFDIFFAADSLRPELLEKDGPGIMNSRFSYAKGRLVLWSPDPQLIDPAGDILRNGEFRFLAIANPALAPYGAAARALLQSMDRWDALQPRLVRGENIDQAFQFVMSGNASLGLVARSQLVRAGMLAQGSGWEVPAVYHAPLLQQVILMRDTAAAREFLRFVQSEQAQDIIVAHGYDLPGANE